VTGFDAQAAAISAPTNASPAARRPARLGR
jgi:hypothetical protein